MPEQPETTDSGKKTTAGNHGKGTNVAKGIRDGGSSSGGKKK